MQNVPKFFQTFFPKEFLLKFQISEQRQREDTWRIRWGACAGQDADGRETACLLQALAVKWS